LTVGWGKLLIENTKIYGKHLVELRPDYGSWFDGEIVIRNCEFLPNNGKWVSDVRLIDGSNNGQWDFLQPCVMPRKITIDGLVINDINPPGGYTGPKIFSNFTPDYTEQNIKEGMKFPYLIKPTEEVEIRNLTTKSGKPLTNSTNPWMFRNVKLRENDIRASSLFFIMFLCV